MLSREALKPLFLLCFLKRDVQKRCAEEGEEGEELAEGEEAKSGASKCPFSGALADMGIDITKMSKEEAMEKMGAMSKIFPDGSSSS